MVKTPEEYFADQCLDVPQAADAALSAAEQAFVQKYLGSDALQTMPVLEPEQVLFVAAVETKDHARPVHHVLFLMVRRPPTSTPSTLRVVSPSRSSNR